MQRLGLVTWHHRRTGIIPAEPPATGAVAPPAAGPAGAPAACLAACLLLAFLAGSSARAAQAPPTAPPRITAVRATGPIRIDGRLDEPDWQRAAIIPDLVQQQPRPGEPTPYATEVRILIDTENVYFGVTCVDPDPERIAMHTMQRDTPDPFGDDFLDVVLDTFGDRRTGYLFEVYPSGAQADGLISGPGGLSIDWDGVWEAKTSLSSRGWTAEIKIPSRTIHFKKGLDSWGLNVGRHVARDRMLLVWCCASLDVDLLDFTRAGRLEGIAGLTQGLGLSVSPYGLGRLDTTRGAHDQTITGDGGLDLSFSPTPGIAGVATLNTDFAETEVDARQINLSRFSLFFPEKRPFFLEGSNQFGFATGLGTDFIPFYSRRVGLSSTDCSGSEESEDAATVPIDWGAKVLGHAGRLGIAALDLETGRTDGTPRTSLFAGRLTYDASDHLRLGAIGTQGCPDGVHTNRFAGLDLVWHTSSLFGGKNMTIGSWTARSDGEVAPCASCGVIVGQRTGWGARIDYPNDHWNAYLAFKELGDALQPALGFVPRPGTRQYEAGQAFQPRPDPEGPFGWARQVFYEAFYTQVDDLEGRTESRRLFTAPFNVETASGEHFEANWVPEFERLTEDFEVATGVTVPAGRYHFTRYRAEAQSSEARPWRIGSTVWLGGFYDGRLTQVETFVHWNVLKGRLQQKLDLQNDYGRMPEGNFIQRLWQLQNVFAFSPRLILFSFLQYDTESSSLGMNTRLRWTLRPGDDLFVVWNRDWDHPLDGTSFELKPRDDRVTVKLRIVWKG